MDDKSKVTDGERTLSRLTDLKKTLRDNMTKNTARKAKSVKPRKARSAIASKAIKISKRKVKRTAENASNRLDCGKKFKIIEGLHNIKRRIREKMKRKDKSKTFENTNSGRGQVQTAREGLKSFLARAKKNAITRNKGDSEVNKQRTLPQKER